MYREVPASLATVVHQVYDTHMPLRGCFTGITTKQMLAHLMAALRRAIRCPSCTRTGLLWPLSWACAWMFCHSCSRASMRDSAAASLRLHQPRVSTSSLPEEDDFCGHPLPCRDIRFHIAYACIILMRVGKGSTMVGKSVGRSALTSCACAGGIARPQLGGWQNAAAPS